MNVNWKAKVHELKLGEVYEIEPLWNWRYKAVVQFIKTTPKGYNFLDIKTSKCVLLRPIYPVKKGIHISSKEKLKFYVSINYIIKKYEPSKI